VTLILWIVRLLVLLLIIRFVVTLVTRAMRQMGGGAGPRQSGRQPNRPVERIGGTLVQDPQCGTYLPQDRAISVVSGGATQFFCSTTCRDAWSKRG
jgi:uncharacterized protein